MIGTHGLCNKVPVRSHPETTRAELKSLPLEKQIEYASRKISVRMVNKAAKQAWLALSNSPSEREARTKRDADVATNTYFINLSSRGGVPKTRHGEVVPLRSEIFRSFVKRMKQDKLVSVRSRADVWNNGVAPFAKDTGEVPASVQLRLQCGPCCQCKMQTRQTVRVRLRHFMIVTSRAAGGRPAYRKLTSLLAVLLSGLSHK